MSQAGSPLALRTKGTRRSAPTTDSEHHEGRGERQEQLPREVAFEIVLKYVERPPS